MQVLIKSGTIINAEGRQKADILVEGEKIVRIGFNLDTNDAVVFDATNKLILPGGVDPHVHLDLPMFGTVSSDDHYTGTKAAAFGGTTTVIDFIPFDFPTMNESIDSWHARAEKAAVDFSAHMNLTRFNNTIEKELPSLIHLGITSVKTFTAYNGRLRLDDGSIFKALRVARDHGMLVMLHAENGDVIDLLVAEALAAGHISPEWHARTRPAWGAVDSALRAFSLAAIAEAPIYLVHMNVAGEVDMLKYAREKGIKAMGETCLQYLFFTEDEYLRPDGAKWICSPPLRKEADNSRLWEGLGSGIVQTIGTDHCPFFFDGTRPILYEEQLVSIPGKELGKDDFTKIPNGLPGVQDRLPVLWTKGVQSGKLSPEQFVTLTSTNPSKIFGLYPRKGAILPGADADIIIWDPEKLVDYGVAMSHQRTDYNLYEGWKLTGYPEKVFLRGKLIVDGEKWLGKKGGGQFLKRNSVEIL
jgi:dihydropyrimidinase